MENVTFHGEFINVENIELDVVHGRHEPRNVPIMIGATGEKMIELTGEIADGIVLNYFVPPAYNDRTLEILESSSKKVGRCLEDIDRPQLVVCAVDQDHDAAIDTTKMLMVQYLAQQPHFARDSGAAPDVVDEIKSILTWPATKEQITQAKHLIPDDLVLRVTASGTPAEARAKVQDYRDHGATCPVLYPVGGNVKLLIDTFAQN
jgi:5,10-methylenetetrahydromethanopterin reductase